MWGWRGRRGDDGDNMWRPQTMETTWGPSGDDVEMTGMMWRRRGWCGDDMGMTGTTRGPRGPRGDNKITKNAITFEQIEIIEFHLKIWDPWALPHTCRLQLMCRWGVSYPKWHFYPKSAPVTLKKIFFLFLHWIPLDHIQIEPWEDFWSPDPFTTHWNRSQNVKKVQNLTKMWIFTHNR